MAPVYCYDDTTTTDIQWISPTESYSSQYPTRLRSDSSADYYVYTPPPKPETRKERITRQSTAFSMFYGKRQYVPKQSKKIAEQKEVSQRENKFKGLNRNLYDNKKSIIS